MDRLAEVDAELKLIEDRLEAIRLSPEPEGDDVARAKVLEDRGSETDDLLTRWDKLNEDRGPLVERAQKLANIAAAARDRARVEPGDGSRYLGGVGPSFNKQIDPFDDDPRRMTNNDVISRAMVVVEREKYVPVTDAAKEHLDKLIHRAYNEEEEGGQFDGSYVARRTLYTENPLYRSAFRKYVRMGTMAHFNDAEARAVAAFQDYELRRAAGEVTTTAGGFGVPVELAA